MEAQQQSQQITKAESAWAGTFHNPTAVQGRLDEARDRFHIVSPAMSVGALPEGFGVSVSLVHVDVKNDTHGVGGGKFGLLKHVLDRLASGLGVRWDPAASGRLDDRRDPRFCCYRVVGRYRGFDGQWREIFDEAELDLRDGSDMAVAIMEKSKSREAGDNQLRDMRKWILRHTLTRARLRAIRGMGIKTSYTEAELEKDFLVFGLSQTGHSRDPELRRQFAIMQFSAALDASNALFGASKASLRELPAQPPLDGELEPEDDDVFDVPPIAEPPRTAVQPQATTPAPTQTATKPSAPATNGAESAGGLPPNETFTMGRLKGDPIVDASDKDVAAYAAFLEKSAADPERARFRAQNLVDAAFCRRVLKSRTGEDEKY